MKKKVEKEEVGTIFKYFEFLGYKTDLEWLSLNFRKVRASNMSTSNRRVLLIMFDQNTQYFPSIREIRDGIIKAQLKGLEEDGLENLKESYAKNWLMLFEIAGLGKNLDAPLTTSILADPNHPVVKHILYLYSIIYLINTKLYSKYSLLNDSIITQTGCFLFTLRKLFLICRKSFSSCTSSIKKIANQIKIKNEYLTLGKDNSNEQKLDSNLPSKLCSGVSDKSN